MELELQDSGHEVPKQIIDKNICVLFRSGLLRIMARIDGDTNLTYGTSATTWYFEPASKSSSVRVTGAQMPWFFFLIESKQNRKNVDKQPENSINMECFLKSSHCIPELAVEFRDGNPTVEHVITVSIHEVGKGKVSDLVQSHRVEKVDVPNYSEEGGDHNYVRTAPCIFLEHFSHRTFFCLRGFPTYRGPRCRWSGPLLVWVSACGFAWTHSAPKYFRLKINKWEWRCQAWLVCHVHRSAHKKIVAKWHEDMESNHQYCSTRMLKPAQIKFREIRSACRCLHNSRAVCRIDLNWLSSQTGNCSFLVTHVT